MEQMSFDLNEILLRGRAAGVPTRSHESHGEVFYRFPLSIPRLSGVADVLNIVVPGKLLELTPVDEGDWLEVCGEVRTYNNRSGVGSRLVITVYARSLITTGEEAANTLALRGTLCRPPAHRHTPLGREICDLMLAVNRKYGRSDYLPCIAWGALAARCAHLTVGDRLSITGRLQSRSYTKETESGPQERVAYEVSVMELGE